MSGIAILLLSSCGGTKLYLDTFAPEESALNLVKITDETSNSVLMAAIEYYNYSSNYATNDLGVSKEKRYAWRTPSLLSVSPDGKKIAYLSRLNKQQNIMVRSTNAQGMATQRTFRNVGSFSWGADNMLYFTDYSGNNSYICAVNAEQGSMMKQLTNGNVTDKSPVITADGKLLFFTRLDVGGPAIWSLNREDGTLTSCARGYNPCLIPNNNDAFYCTRNNTEGRSEIWYVNYVKGEETLVASDMNHSFTNPVLSPDGKWIVCVGNSVSSINESNNLDIFAVKTDGTSLTQLTYHPMRDCSPAWSKDGRSIYFISDRANKDQFPNIWRMNFNLE